MGIGPVWPAVLGHVTCVGIACEGCVWFCVSVCVTLVGGGSVVVGMGVVVRDVAVVGVLFSRNVCNATGMGAVGWCTMGGGSSVGMTVSWTLGGQLGGLGVRCGARCV